MISHTSLHASLRLAECLYMQGHFPQKLHKGFSEKNWNQIKTKNIEFFQMEWNQFGIIQFYVRGQS